MPRPELARLRLQGRLRRRPGLHGRGDGRRRRPLLARPRRRRGRLRAVLSRLPAGSERHDRDRARGQLLVAVVAVVVVVVDDLPQPRVVRIRRLEHARRRGTSRAADLDLDVRLVAQVEGPARRLIGPCLRRDHEVVVAVARVHQRVRPLSARATADRPQEQRRHADHLVPDAPAGRLVDRLVDAQYLALDAHLPVFSTCSTFQIPTAVTCRTRTPCDGMRGPRDGFTRVEAPSKTTLRSVTSPIWSWCSPRSQASWWEKVELTRGSPSASTADFPPASSTARSSWSCRSARRRASCDRSRNSLPRSIANGTVTATIARAISAIAQGRRPSRISSATPSPPSTATTPAAGNRKRGLPP